MNDDLDRLLEKANELENEEENTTVTNDPVSNETENKNEDISHKLYELLINSNSDSSYKKVTNNNQVINNTPTTSHEDEPEFITNDKSIPYNNSRDTTNYPTNNTMLFDDIPDCYK